MCLVVTTGLASTRYPDLLIALNADIEAYRRYKGYIITEHGKPM